MDTFTGTLTNDIYWASKDPRIVALRTLPDIGSRDTAAYELDKLGLIIDRQIDVWGWDPHLVMGYRLFYGDVWVPNAYQPNALNTSDYFDINKIWQRAIRVSIDATDYKPFNPPTPDPPPSTSTIGVLNGGQYTVNRDVAQINGQFIFKNGQHYKDSTGDYTFHNEPGLFMPMIWWTKN